MHNSVRNFPWMLIFCALSLLAAGLCGIQESEKLVASSGRMFRQQVLWAALAISVAAAAAYPQYAVMRRWAYAGFAASLFLLVAVYWFPAVNGSHRWIRIGPIGLQPSELAKLFFIAALARWLMYRNEQRRLVGWVVPLLLAVLPAALVLREPDLGTALLFFPVLMAVMLAAGVRWSHLAMLLLSGLMLLPAFWSLMSREQVSRVTAVLQQTGPGENPDDDGFHLHHAKRLVALGGTAGIDNRHDEAIAAVHYVPAAATDSIFVVLAARFGLLGVAVLLGLYFVLLQQMLSIALRTGEPFARLFVVGVAALLASQVVTNTAMMVGLLPITGLALPLVSYGGSGLVANGLAVGLVINIALRPHIGVRGEPFRVVASTTATSQAAA
ncbi:MAG: FtsW/RodA/SpoVE family cell cycle protein [Pirellulales bacterium]